MRIDIVELDYVEVAKNGDRTTTIAGDATATALHVFRIDCEGPPTTHAVVYLGGAVVRPGRRGEVIRPSVREMKAGFLRTLRGGESVKCDVPLASERGYKVRLMGEGRVALWGVRMGL